MRLDRLILNKIIIKLDKNIFIEYKN